MALHDGEGESSDKIWLLFYSDNELHGKVVFLQERCVLLDVLFGVIDQFFVIFRHISLFHLFTLLGIKIYESWPSQVPGRL